jgi:hypothetical protein
MRKVEQQRFFPRLQAWEHGISTFLGGWEKGVVNNFPLSGSVHKKMVQVQFNGSIMKTAVKLVK